LLVQSDAAADHGAGMGVVVVAELVVVIEGVAVVFVPDLDQVADLLGVSKFTVQGVGAGPLVGQLRSC
ncbi:MAG: hypothetical protein ACR2PK_18080, partial [Acidimicrobiales bacterium]